MNNSSNDILVVFIVGLGESKNGPLLGFRTFIEDLMKTEPRVKFISGQWDDKQSLVDISNEMRKYDKILGSAHSHGSHRLIELANGNYGNNTIINELVSLDAKPPLWEHFFDWWNPNYLYPIPSLAKICQSFYSGFGRPFKNGPNVVNVKLNIPHEKFPSNPIVQQYIKQRIGVLLYK